ncbi:MAG: Succinate dehydrogenase iron-sulfur protein (EC [uncultured Sulfurovum sp.]|uniref:Fumarate reductase iron-sulfur subunit n=1 Tax=uncultured Sulfurovum sp. TaxID=269237 RepID=A0A6S6T5R8_9BACT|nr:MAG: Succinate dehydrogenase iron-sulfur protein (EC [uncultured Sulfurovum sp.]
MKITKITVIRSESNSPRVYTLPDGEMTLLHALSHIKSTTDATLTFSSGCRASVCGTCAVRVNGKEVLACAHKVSDGDLIEPLQYHPVLRDLKVDKHKSIETLSKSSAWLQNYTEASLTHTDEKRSELQTDCILCDSCYSACPVYAVNPEFLGPFALTRAFRYTIDKREGEAKTIVDNIQANGVWDCTLCGECTLACPKGIDPKMDITMLRGKSIEFGYDDPTFAQQNFGTPDFGGGGFGFNPNGGF